MSAIPFRSRFGRRRAPDEAEDLRDAASGSPPDTEYSTDPPPNISSGGSTRSGLRTSATGFSLLTRSSTATRNTKAQDNPLGLQVVYEPTTSVKANIVFIHGLGGTSRMTWSKNKDKQLFWPQMFLPYEEDIASARILTFGYNAEVASGNGRSIVSVLDFAKDFLYELKYARDENSKDLAIASVPLIFVAHSMGGLIVKEAYMQGQFDPEYEDVVKAVTAILFMSTPHRGTHLAETLKRILKVSLVSTTPQQYINDLVNNSGAIQKINEQFRHFATKISIVSFYETRRTAMGKGIPPVMIVEKDSSVLGYPGEVSRPLDADHHTVCKFDDNKDPNYVTVRNYLISHMKKLFTRSRRGSRSSAGGSIGSTTPVETRDLESLLAITDLPDLDYIFFRERWTPGTGEWILEEPSFQQWLGEVEEGPKLLWLHGPGGSGKSILASFIVNHLHETGLSCQYVFVRFGDQMKKSLSFLLQSLAFQLAQALPMYRNALVKVLRGVKLRGTDPRVIWQRVFNAVLPKIELAEPLYWVIDGLEECDAARQATKLFTEVLQGSAAIRVLIISRRSVDIEAELKKIPPARWEMIALENQADDYRHFIDQELGDEWSDDPILKDEITAQLLEKAQNSFLWLKLTLDRINQCHMVEDVERALQGLLPGMEDLFDAMAESICAQEGADRDLTTSLLSWVTCSFRLLTVADLSQALDEQRRIVNFQRSINELCAGFVVIDNDDTVALVHQTAREYLLSKDRRAFGINRKVAHEKLFFRCLKAFQATPGFHAKPKSDQQSTFITYAASYWAAHLWACDSVSDHVVSAVIDFLRSTSVLTWIQAVAQAGDLHFVIQTSTHLASFENRLRRANVKNPPLDRPIAEQELIKQWATDLGKIVGRFGVQLLRNPESIHRTIPPFCPPESAIYKQFGCKDPRHIFVSSPSNTGWDDNVARLSFGHDYQTSGILSQGQWILVTAIKDNCSSVFVYNAETYQETRRINHGERVRKIQVNTLGTLLVTCGFSTTKVWDLSNGTCLARATNPSGRPRPQAIAFVREDTCVLISTEDRRQWLLPIDGEDSVFEQATRILDRNANGGLVNPPICAAFSPDGRFLALGYRKSPLSVWEFDGVEYVCVMRCPELERLQEIMWHPLTGEILGMHTGGEIFKWNLEENSLMKVHSGASTMVLGPEGNMMAIGDMRGNVSILSTTDLSLVYRSVSQDPVVGIAFSADSVQLHDVRHGYGNIWEPDVLLKLSEPALQHSDAESGSITMESAQSLSETLYNKVDPVTALAPQPNAKRYCTGSEQGVVAIHDSPASTPLELSRSSNFMGIEQVEWNDDGTLVCSADLSRTVLVHQIKQTTNAGKMEAEQILDMSIGDLSGNIDQVLFQPGGELLLVCSRLRTVSISISDARAVSTADMDDSGGRWIVHPSNRNYLLFIKPSVLDIYTWATLQKVASINLDTLLDDTPTDEETTNEANVGPSETISSLENRVDTLAANEDNSKCIQKLLFTSSRQQLLVQLSLQTDDHTRTMIRLLDISTLSNFPAENLDPADLTLEAEEQTITSIDLPRELEMRIHLPLSFVPARASGPDRLIFLDCDSEICSWTVPRRHSISSPPSLTPFGMSRASSVASVPDVWSLSQSIGPRSPDSRPVSALTHRHSAFSPPRISRFASTPNTFRRESAPTTGDASILSLSRRKSTPPNPAFRSAFASPSRRESAGSIGTTQSGITAHYCLPGDWVILDCLRLMRTLGDGTLLCPRNGEISTVRCTTLTG